jgi:hypothetical protein
MKLWSLLGGLVIGALIGIILTNLYKSSGKSNNKENVNFQLPEKGKWQWADSLDAVKIIFENNEIRILEVTLGPYEFEQLHTHSFPSVMFGPDNDTSQFDIIYYPYTYDSANHRYFARDSIKQHQGGQPNEPNVGYYMKPEGPHRIKNLSNVRILAYRVEFKTGK